MIQFYSLIWVTVESHPRESHIDQIALKIIQQLNPGIYQDYENKIGLARTL